MIEAAEILERLFAQDFEMLRRIVIDEGDRLVLIARQHDAADRPAKHGR